MQPACVLCWAAGLAHDTLSAENAVIILQSERPPLILDPSGQASHWLQTHLKAKGANHEVVPMHSDRCTLASSYVLDTCATDGMWLL